MKKDYGGVRGELSFSLKDFVFKTQGIKNSLSFYPFPPMKQLKNFIESHKHSKCGGSYRKGVVFDSSDAICRMFSLKNFVFKTQEIKRRSLFICSSILRHPNWINILKIMIQFSTQGAGKRTMNAILLKIRLITQRI